MDVGYPGEAISEGDTGPMTKRVDAATLKTMINDGRELALLDVREHGQFGEGHLLLTIPVPYSTLEANLDALLPRRDVRTVLVDDGDGVAEKAAARMQAVGFTDIAILDGGVDAWAAAGNVIFKGENVPSKAFGEVVEHAAHTPSISADELHAMFEKGEDLVVVDGRTPEEYRRMSIPNGISVPNAELVYRIHDIAPSPDTTVVVNCAGRTRSIIGAQTLRNAGIPNKVVALRAGTMGWRLAGFELDHGASRKYPDVSESGMAAAKARADEMVKTYAIPKVDRATVDAWRGDASRTLYILDVRSADEYEAGHLPGAAHAPGGQLVQRTDSWVGTRGARVVLTDDTEIRAITAAHWLIQMGWDVHVLEGGVGAAATEKGMPARTVRGLDDIDVDEMTPAEVDAALKDGSAVALDVDLSADYRKAHLPGAVWGIRPRLRDAVAKLPTGKRIVVYSEHETRARLAVPDLRALTDAPVALLKGGREAWTRAGLPTESSPDTPPDAERIDYLFFVHDRHDGNETAMRDYLSWEEGLPAQIEADGDANFRVITR
jgi:rhodanese-related sulfurtransferase